MLPPSRRPARRKGRVAAFGHQLLRPRRDVIDEHADPVVQIADIDDLLVIGRKARTDRQRLAVGDAFVVAAIAVHDRQLLYAISLKSEERSVRKRFLSHCSTRGWTYP